MYFFIFSNNELNSLQIMNVFCYKLPGLDINNECNLFNRYLVST